jgi:hypothetical protein
MTDNDLQYVLDLIDEVKERQESRECHETPRRCVDDDIEIIVSDRPSKNIPEEAREAML